MTKIMNSLNRLSFHPLWYFPHDQLVKYGPKNPAVLHCSFVNTHLLFTFITVLNLKYLYLRHSFFLSIDKKGLLAVSPELLGSKKCFNQRQ